MYENLEAACGGAITIESIRRFQLAMREYEVFMSGMSRLLAPASADHKRTAETHKTGVSN